MGKIHAKLMRNCFLSMTFARLTVSGIEQRKGERQTFNTFALSEIGLCWRRQGIIAGGNLKGKTFGIAGDSQFSFKVTVSRLSGVYIALFDAGKIEMTLPSVTTRCG
jgi:hypothetical protein